MPTLLFEGQFSLWCHLGSFHLCIFTPLEQGILSPLPCHSFNWSECSRPPFFLAHPHKNCWCSESAMMKVKDNRPHVYWEVYWVKCGYSHQTQFLFQSQKPRIDFIQMPWEGLVCCLPLKQHGHKSSLGSLKMTSTATEHKYLFQCCTDMIDTLNTMGWGHKQTKRKIQQNKKGFDFY